MQQFLGISMDGCMGRNITLDKYLFCVERSCKTYACSPAGTYTADDKADKLPNIARKSFSQHGILHHGVFELYTVYWVLFTSVNCSLFLLSLFNSENYFITVNIYFT